MNYKRGLTFQVAIFSPQSQYFFIFSASNRYSMILVGPTENIFTSWLTFEQKTSVKRLKALSLRFVFEFLQRLQENAN